MKIREFQKLYKEQWQHPKVVQWCLQIREELVISSEIRDRNASLDQIRSILPSLAEELAQKCG